MKKKDEVFRKFKEFKALIKNHTKKRSRLFDQTIAENSLQMSSKNYVKNQGLRGSFQLLIIQQNGIAERKNRTIMEAARAMLHDQDIPMHIWAEAARTVVYVQNHTRHRVLENNTPEEAFSSKKPEVSHLRIFGCPVYIHIPK